MSTAFPFRPIVDALLNRTGHPTSDGGVTIYEKPPVLNAGFLDVGHTCEGIRVDGHDPDLLRSSKDPSVSRNPNTFTRDQDRDGMGYRKNLKEKRSEK